MSGLQYEKHQLTEEELAVYTPEKCWADVDRLAELLSVPGYLQSELRLHPEHGPVFIEKSKELMHLLVEHYDFGVAPADPEVVKKLADLFRELEMVQASHLLGEISIGGMAMQMIPFEEMMESVDYDLSKVTDKMTPEQKEAFEKASADNKANGHGVASAKLNPRMIPIFAAGVMAAGGQAEFAAIQMQCARELPDEYQGNPSLVFASQMTGAVMKALLNRATSGGFPGTQLRATIEQVIAAKQAVSMSYVAAWDASPMQLFGALQEAAVNAMDGALNGGCQCESCKVAAAEEANPAEPAKETSTTFAGNGTVN